MEEGWGNVRTILELNSHGLVRAFHKEPTRSKEVSQELRVGALRLGAQLVP